MTKDAECENMIPTLIKQIGDAENEELGCPVQVIKKEAERTGDLRFETQRTFPEQKWTAQATIRIHRTNFKCIDQDGNTVC